VDSGAEDLQSPAYTAADETIKECEQGCLNLENNCERQELTEMSEEPVSGGQLEGDGLKRRNFQRSTLPRSNLKSEIDSWDRNDPLDNWLLHKFQLELSMRENGGIKSKMAVNEKEPVY